MSTLAHRPPQSHVRTGGSGSASGANGVVTASSTACGMASTSTAPPPLPTPTTMSASNQFHPRTIYRSTNPAPKTSSERWRLESFVDKSSGQSREIVVLEDTPTPEVEAGPSHSNGIIHAKQMRPPFQPPASKRTKVANGDAYSGYDNPPPTLSYLKANSPFQSGIKGKRKLDHFAAGQQFRDDDRERKRKEQEKMVPCDDKEGHYIVRANDILSDRYRVIKLLGQGTFGKVVQAVDLHSELHPHTGRQNEVAVKVIRAVQKYRDASKVEIKVLRLLAERDSRNINKCIHLVECFDYRNHICIVTELLSQSVFDFLKDNQYNPFPSSHIQSFAKQLLSSVAFLHELRLIHTDLKPENILLVDSLSRTVPVKASYQAKGGSSAKTKKILRNSEIRLIDFGSATFEEEYHASVVSTRHYRAPEIILGLGWSYPCDVWSIGCILIEFFTGEALFQTHENLEHLAMMEIVFGKMPDSMSRRATKSKPEWFKHCKLDYPQTSTSRQSRKFVRAMRRIEDIIPQTSIVNARFRDLLEKLLTWEPSQRITVKEALKHNYFALKIDDESNLN